MTYSIDLTNLTISHNGAVIHTEEPGRFAHEGLRIAIEDLGLSRAEEKALLRMVPASEDEKRLAAGRM